ncbi:MAG: hypothetical protein HY744_03170 [Deltaproteobacteria bacterium]|nr:hypothetical protein [Deltaproteobacteria bacterium]
MVAASVPVSAWAERALLPPGWTTDEQGRVLRVSFDPGARWLLGAGYAPRHGAGGAQPELAQIETGLAYRHRIDFPGEGISYKLYHRVLAGRAVAGPRSPWEIDAALYEGRFLRWSRDGSIMLPTNPPRRMLLPLNIGVEATLGRIDLAPRPAGPAAEIGVVRAELLLDLWRRRAMGSYAELGLGPRYDLRLGGDDAAAVRHVVAPFTQGSFTFHHETADGLHGVEARLSGGPALSVAERWGARAEAVVSYEAILVAVNDLPLSAYAELGYRYEGLPAPAGGVPEVRATTGLRFAVPLR